MQFPPIFGLICITQGLESHGILEFHFPGLESHGIEVLVMKSHEK